VEIAIKGHHSLINDQHILHHIGECKSRKGKKFGHHQLLHRLALINSATQTLFDSVTTTMRQDPRSSSAPSWVKANKDNLRL
jgi:hypothetical protein